MSQPAWSCWSVGVGGITDFCPRSASSSHLRVVLWGLQADWQHLGLLLHWSRWEWSPGAHTGILQHDRWDHCGSRVVTFTLFEFHWGQSTHLEITLHWSTHQRLSDSFPSSKKSKRPFGALPEGFQPYWLEVSNFINVNVFNRSKQTLHLWLSSPKAGSRSAFERTLVHVVKK